MTLKEAYKALDDAWLSGELIASVVVHPDVYRAMKRMPHVELGAGMELGAVSVVVNAYLPPSKVMFCDSDGRPLRVIEVTIPQSAADRESTGHE